MKNPAIKLIIIIIASAFAFYGCQKEVELNNGSPKTPENIQAWYEAHSKGNSDISIFSKSTLNKKSKIATEANKSITAIIPDWSNAEVTINGDSTITEVPVQGSHDFGFSTLAAFAHSAEPLKSSLRLVVTDVNGQTNGQYVIMVEQTPGNSDFNKLSVNRLAESDFTGLLFTYKLDGTFISGARFVKGKKDGNIWLKTGKEKVSEDQCEMIVYQWEIICDIIDGHLANCSPKTIINFQTFYQDCGSGGGGGGGSGGGSNPSVEDIYGYEVTLLGQITTLSTLQASFLANAHRNKAWDLYNYLQNSGDERRSSLATSSINKLMSDPGYVAFVESWMSSRSPGKDVWWEDEGWLSDLDNANLAIDNGYFEALGLLGDLDCITCFQGNQSYQAYMVPAEITLFNAMSTIDKANYLKNAVIASRWAKVLFPNIDTIQIQGKGDAFRHAMFSFLNSESFGISVAENMGNAHENWAGNDVLDKAMDLHNNSQGRDAYTASSWWQLRPKLILALVRNGSLKYLKNGVLVWTNQ